MVTVTIPYVDPSVINSNPEIMGGEPVFAGTRVPVHLLREHLTHGGSLATFLSSYPTVERDNLVQVLDLLFERTVGPPDDDDKDPA